jgi:acyl dehydratase
MSGLYFEEFEVGRRLVHEVHRTVTETDNLLFSALTMNPAAIHLDAEYCKGTPYGQPLVNSVFTLGLMVGLSVYDTTFGTTVANLGWEDVRFPKPVFVGDTLRVRPLSQPCAKANPARTPASSPSSTTPITSATRRWPPAAGRR